MFGKLVIQIGSVCNDDNSGRFEKLTLHQHAGKEHHGVALAAAGGTEVCTTFTVTNRTDVLLDVVEQLVGSKELRIYVGRAINPAHQNPELPITFSIKMNLVEELSACLKKMGKRIKVSYF